MPAYLNRYTLKVAFSGLVSVKLHTKSNQIIKEEAPNSIEGIIDAFRLCDLLATYFKVEPPGQYTCMDGVRTVMELNNWYELGFFTAQTQVEIHLS